MKNITIKLLIPMSLALALGACSTTPKNLDSQETTTVVTQTVQPVHTNKVTSIYYVVQLGDGLGSIAEQFTGQVSNWREIASYNNISEPRKLGVGAELEIPGYLLPGYEEQVVSEPTQIAISVPTRTPAAPPTSNALRISQKPVIVPVKLSSVNVNRKFELIPWTPSENTTPRKATVGTQIKVVGTYFPKGIYTNAAAGSDLIARVSPGTVFSLESEINDWYRIEMASGLGYIRRSDATIIK